MCVSVNVCPCVYMDECVCVSLLTQHSVLRFTLSSWFLALSLHYQDACALIPEAVFPFDLLSTRIDSFETTLITYHLSSLQWILISSLTEALPWLNRILLNDYVPDAGYKRTVYNQTLCLPCLARSPNRNPHTNPTAMFSLSSCEPSCWHGMYLLLFLSSQVISSGRVWLCFSPLIRISCRLCGSRFSLGIFSCGPSLILYNSHRLSTSTLAKAT